MNQHITFNVLATLTHYSTFFSHHVHFPHSNYHTILYIAEIAGWFSEYFFPLMRQQRIWSLLSLNCQTLFTKYTSSSNKAHFVLSTHTCKLLWLLSISLEWLHLSLTLAVSFGCGVSMLSKGMQQTEGLIFDRRHSLLTKTYIRKSVGTCKINW